MSNPYTAWEADRARREAQWRKEERRFHWIVGVSVGIFFLLLGAFAWWIVASEPQRRAAYVANCESKGFSAEQCRFLYAERSRQDADNAAAVAIGAAALATAASRR